MKVFLTLCVFCTLGSIPASGGDQLRLAVSPAQSFAPSNVNIRARIAPSAENRSLEVIAESEGFYRASQIQLEGERSPATIVFELRGLPAGNYEILAILSDAAGRNRAIAVQQLRVIGIGDGQ